LFSGVYVKETCYIYSVLQRICLKISIEETEEGKELEYEGGCYES